MGLLMKMAFLAMVFVVHSVVARSRPATGGSRRMIGGNEADIEDWTFLAQLKFLNPDIIWKTCSATLTAKNVLMTAAHCVDELKDKPEDLEVNIATKSKGSNEWTTTVFEVKDILVNPKYPRDVYLWDHDTAMIILKKPVPGYLEHIHVAAVDDDVKNCKSAGWGTTEIGKSTADVEKGNYDIPDTLQEIDVPLVPWKKCKDPFSKTHEEFARNNSMVFCGGAIGNEKGHTQGSCFGDSGSPLICDGPIGKVLKGIMLGGRPDCVPGKSYMVFADVPKEIEAGEKELLSGILG